MSKFSLSSSKAKMFPEMVKCKSGIHYSINADFKNILKILRLYNDNFVLDAHKPFLVLRWFYTENIPDRIETALKLLYNFMSNSNDDEEIDQNKKVRPQFDYEFDAEEIYASFLQEYNIDLYEVEFLHWYKFRLLLANLSQDTAFKSKIQLRFADLKEYKGENFAKMQRAKQEIQLPEKYTFEEQKALSEMKRKLQD